MTTRQPNPQQPSESSDTNRLAVMLEHEAAWYPVHALTPFGFETTAPQLAQIFEAAARDTTVVYRGSLQADAASISVTNLQFRIRGARENKLRCTFHDTTLMQRESVQRLCDRLQEKSRGDALQALSYDELACGGVKRGSQSQIAAAKKPASKGKTKALVAFLMSVGMVAIVAWVLVFVRMQSSVKVNNSVMMGNYLPINSPLEGQITELLISEGDKVTAGQLLARISNQAFCDQIAQTSAQLQAARREVAALERTEQEFLATIDVTKRKLEGDIRVARDELLRLQHEHRVATLRVNRLRPLLAEQNIALVEFEEAESQQAALAAGVGRQTATIATIVLAREAADANLIFSGGLVQNPLSDIRAHVEIARARCDELSQTHAHLAERARPVELTAPRAGIVFAVYRNVGETLKVADEIAALSHGGETWATGHIAADQAASIRPGQQVEIDIPALDMTAQGTIVAIGHRAVHARGHYSADFRGGPMEVPIKVAIDHLPGDVPPGLRLNMTVRLFDRLAWLHNLSFPGLGGGAARPAEPIHPVYPGSNSITSEVTFR